MSDETIFNEINDELRSDRMKQMWRTYGPWVIGAAVLIVVAVGANEGWRWYQNSVIEASSDQYYDAMIQYDEGDVEGAQAALNEVIASGSGQYPDLARFSQASILAQTGDTDAALAAYDALANSLSDQSLRDLATLQGAALLVDSGNVTDVQSRLVGLLAQDHELRNMARELLGLTQYAAGDGAAAMETFDAIKLDPLAGQDIMQRINLFDAQLIAEGYAAADLDVDAASQDAAQSDSE